jgi:predicted PurR-regulated permease PerM
MNISPLARTSNLLLIAVLITAALYFAQAFLIPLTFAAILAMLFIPLSKRLEKRGINRALAAIICILILILVFAGIGSLLAWQLSDLSEDMSGIEQKFKKFISQIENYIATTFGIDPKEQQKIVKEQANGGSTGQLAKIMGSIFSIAVNTILVLVYIFLLMYFRRHLKNFLLRITPDNQKENVGRLTHDASRVSQQYITGLAMMIGTLWILYGIGFSIVGVQYAIFFAILCGILEIVPFIGNIAGTTITVLMAIIQGGDINLVLGILITYAMVQFIQTYLLEPLVVGNEVNINPLFTIVGIVAGEALWGIPGMILAIPLIGILKIVCDHFEPLKPYGFLLGQEKNKTSTNFTEKLKNWRNKLNNR